MKTVTLRDLCWYWAGWATAFVCWAVVDFMEAAQ